MWRRSSQQTAQEQEGIQTDRREEHSLDEELKNLPVVNFTYSIRLALLLHHCLDGQCSLPVRWCQAVPGPQHVQSFSMSANASVAFSCHGELNVLQFVMNVFCWSVLLSRVPHQKIHATEGSQAIAACRS